MYDILKAARDFTLTQSTTLSSGDDITRAIEHAHIHYPVVAKPVRGRGSHGVKLCQNQQELRSHVLFLIKEAPKTIIEEYLSVEEATVTVMPPSASNPEYQSIPIVTRFNHADGIAPYNGTVAVTQDSRLVTDDEQAADSAQEQAARECERVAALLRVTAATLSVVVDSFWHPVSTNEIQTSR